MNVTYYCIINGPVAESSLLLRSSSSFVCRIDYLFVFYDFVCAKCIGRSSTDMVLSSKYFVLLDFKIFRTQLHSLYIYIRNKFSVRNHSQKMMNAIIVGFFCPLFTV